MPINVLVNGAFGRMGQLVVKTLSSYPLFNVVGQTGREYDLAKSIHDSGAQVVVDFTCAEAVLANATTIIDAGACPVIGTSGLVREQVNKLQEKCAALKRGGIIVPNFSLGAVLMMKCAKEIIKYLPNVEIIELHHEKKVDSPSGTAMRTAELLAEACPTLNQNMGQAHETLEGARGALYHDVPIHAIRLPGLLAHQQVLFGSAGETLSLRHDTIDRESFMPGVKLACEKVITLNKMVYGLESIL